MRLLESLQHTSQRLVVDLAEKTSQVSVFACARKSTTNLSCSSVVCLLPPFTQVDLLTNKLRSFEVSVCLSCSRWPALLPSFLLTVKTLLPFLSASQDDHAEEVQASRFQVMEQVGSFWLTVCTSHRQ